MGMNEVGAMPFIHRHEVSLDWKIWYGTMPELVCGTMP